MTNFATRSKKTIALQHVIDSQSAGIVPGNELTNSKR